MKNNIRWRASPNFNMRHSGQTPQLIVVHYTDMLSPQAALERLCDPTSEVSAHYLIDQWGTIYQLVDTAYRAWHAGKSFWQGQTDINNISIGIELDNPGHSNTYMPFPTAQIEALLHLLKTLCHDHKISSFAILGHSDVAPERKQDPGELFPWSLLNAHGLGLIPASAPLRPIPQTNAHAQEILHHIGYGNGSFEKMLLAFQRHFTPHEINGSLTPLTAELLSRIPYLTFFP